jgi:hypothetical protein
MLPDSLPEWVVWAIAAVWVGMALYEIVPRLIHWR